PAALDRVVLRGLERDRERRYPDLESFRQALLALVPNRLTAHGLARRLLAYLFDFALLWVAARAVVAVLSALAPTQEGTEHRAQLLALGRALGFVLLLAYFTVSEHVWGCSLGKALATLRVCTTRWIDPPGWGKAGLRALLFCGLVHFGWLVGALVQSEPVGEIHTPAEWAARASGADPLWLTGGWAAVGGLLLCATMRATNGYRGLHEIVSGTRLAELPVPGRGEALLGT